MSNKIATAGNIGPKVRSDCFVTLELKESGGLQIEVKSKVKVLYGDSISELAKQVLEHFEIKNASLLIEDKGAIPSVLAARIEAAIKLLIETDKEFLLDMIEENQYSSKKEQFRFSRLYLPGNSPSMMLNAGIHEPNGIILDLEDSVAYTKKHEAQLIVRNALRGINFYGAERMVRINQFPKGLEDLKYLIPHNVHMLLVPKCEGAEQIQELEKKIEEIKKVHGVTKPIVINVKYIGEGKDPWGGYRIGFEGTSRIALADFNITRNLGPASKELDLIFAIEGVRKSGK